MTNGGRHRGVKLAERSIVQRHENRVLTTHSSSPTPQAISWIWMLPVTWQERGRKQASCRPGGSSLAVTAGTSTYSQTCTVVPMASRSPCERQAHRRLERAEVGVEVVPLVADHHQLARLVGGDQQRGPQAAEQRREVGRVHGPQAAGAGGLVGAGSSLIEEGSLRRRIVDTIQACCQGLSESDHPVFVGQAFLPELVRRGSSGIQRANLLEIGTYDR